MTVTQPYRDTAIELDALHEALIQRATELQKRIWSMEGEADATGAPLNKEQYNRLCKRLAGYRVQSAQVFDAAGVAYSFGTAAEGIA